MIGTLTGSVDRSGINPALIRVGGVGYLVHMPPGSLSKITSGEVTVHTHLHVRDDALELYGFLTLSELDMFTMLLTVPGIGPRTALLVIDRGVDRIKDAVSGSDTDFFLGIPRLGKKNAQKIIIELKSKIGSVRDLDLSGAAPSETKEVFDALAELGFAKPEILQALKKLDAGDVTVEAKLRHALKILGRPAKSI
ncbi:Holliday junction DNA helicase RuvA [Candidatus Gottesmanbacteria bacterium RBG_16_52_11]|uniref:Holliday junction branch migration complex subunit RuvA n=1 Tax=Candidatus Gottesmanbacteria bacterium RBG_16_52_11 TaxID=1798374 RepID=A0A1F5YMK9_9BACT|nr:MAG: Holliday junction DNA helicase RuvA [Candidatus Gottesmanbacteria bacterium RBG_16_52_11]